MTEPLLDAATRDALERSPLGRLPADLQAKLLDGALQLDAPAGSTVYQEGERPAYGVIVSGLIRMYMTAPDGRQVTVRYARSGELAGVPAVIGRGAPVNTQILTSTRALMLNPETLRALGKREAQLGWLLAEEVTKRVFGVLEALSGYTFGSVRQRVAWHLLELAARQQHGEGLVARITQQELADSVGSVRQVVARTLGDLRREGLIATGAGGIVVLDPDVLHEQAWGGGLSPK
jgi:CRP/FNR family transcriptional regulator